MIKKCIFTLISFGIIIGAMAQKNEIELKQLSPEAMKIRDYVRKDIVIAHRGSTYWTPEETEAAYRWARNMGADYLEIDLQMTKDGVLIALHDNNLRRTTNIKKIFPRRKSDFVNSFTLKELRMLDAGSWFNKKNKKRAVAAFVDEKILTLEDVIQIAEGCRIARDADGNRIKRLDNGQWAGHYVYEKDAADNGNRPGIYIETKEPDLFPGIEQELAKQLAKHHWLITGDPKEIQTVSGKVDVANTKARIILQTFSRESIVQLEKHLQGIPKCMLLWKSGMGDDGEEIMADWINFSVQHHVAILGTSIGGKPNNYADITQPWVCQMAHRAGMLVHAYSFDTKKQLMHYNGDYYYENNESRFLKINRKPAEGQLPERTMFIDGGFTNLTDLSLAYQNRANKFTAQEVLLQLGYR